MKNIIKQILIVILLSVLVIPVITNASLTPVTWIRDTVAGFVRPGITTDTLRIPSLTNCDTIDTDADGDFSCGTDGGGGGGHVIQEEGSDLTQRTNLNFIGPTVTATDNSGADSTDVTIDDDLTNYDNSASKFLASGDFVSELSNDAGYVYGSGTTDEITYWVDSDTLGALAVATYPSLTELSYVKGTTSAIQTQLNAKAPIASPTFTGTATIPTANFGSSSGVSGTASSGTLTLTGLSGTAEDITLGLASNNTVNVGTGTGVANWVWNNTMSLLAGNSNWLLSGASSSYFGNGSGAALRTGFGGVTSPTAKIHIGAGTTAASTAPLKFTAGTNMTTPEAGAIEFDGTDLFYTTSTPTRRTVANLAGTQTLSNKTLTSAVLNTGVSGTAIADVSTTNTGTSATTIVTPDGLAGSYAGTKNLDYYILDAQYLLTTGDGKAYSRIPADLNGMDIIGVACGVNTTSSSGTPTIQLARGRQSSATSAHSYVDVLSTRVTIDATEYDSKDATSASVINTSNDDLATGDLLRWDIDVTGTGTKGLSCNVRARLP